MNEHLPPLPGADWLQETIGYHLPAHALNSLFTVLGSIQREAARQALAAYNAAPAQAVPSDEREAFEALAVQLSTLTLAQDAQGRYVSAVQQMLWEGFQVRRAFAPAANAKMPSLATDIASALALPGVERLRDFAAVGPVQLASVEEFAYALTEATPAAKAEPESEWETRKDGRRVRKDRWEWGVRRIVALLWGNRQQFEVDEVVDALRALLPLPHVDDEALARAVQEGGKADATGQADPLPSVEHIKELAQEAFDQVMEQAQVFASAWSLVGGRFDTGNAMADAEEAKAELRTLVRALADLTAQTVRPIEAEADEPVYHLRGYGDVSASDLDAYYKAHAAKAEPVTNDAARDAQETPFESWWEKEGQFCRAGGGDYEKTFAWHAWLAAKAEATGQAEPVAWTLQETLDKRETTCSAHLWFADPINSAWSPLYTHRPKAAQPLTRAQADRIIAALDPSDGGFEVVVQWLRGIGGEGKK